MIVEIEETYVYCKSNNYLQLRKKNHLLVRTNMRFLCNFSCNLFLKVILFEGEAGVLR